MSLAAEWGSPLTPTYVSDHMFSIILYTNHFVLSHCISSFRMYFYFYPSTFPIILFIDLCLTIWLICSSLSLEESSDLHALILAVSKSQTKTYGKAASCRFASLFTLLIKFQNLTPLPLFFCPYMYFRKLQYFVKYTPQSMKLEPRGDYLLSIKTVMQKYAFQL